ncbi:MAG TPA: T9SS type A sorting domain-containing protein [Bacteroidales bacterium]|nr:T9SS type A sorting domain-containing protein [Bacteroidales bacterium]
MKKSIYILIVLLCVCSALTAQTSKAEYFFDTDPGVGLATQVTITQVGDTGVFTGNISTNGLSVGFHRLYFRFQDINAKWGLTENTLLYVYSTTAPSSYPPVQAQLSKFEYFFDTDPGPGLGIQVPATGINDTATVTMNVSTLGLSVGFHRLYYRSKDLNNQWGLTENQLLYVYDTSPPVAMPVQPQLTGMEFFIDTDPTVGLGTAVAGIIPGDTILSSVDVPTAALTAGPHTINFRVKDAMKRWSHYDTRQIIICSSIPVAYFSVDTVCQGSVSHFTDLSTNILGSTTYKWDMNSDGTNEFTTLGNKTYTYAAAGTYTATLIVANPDGCSTTYTQNVLVNPIPATPVITQVFDTLVSSAATGNQWYKTGTGLIGGATSQKYQPTQNGNYYVVVTLIGCSSANSNTLDYVISSIDNISGDSGISIYPNPAIKTLFIDGLKGETVISIYDVSGKLLIREEPRINMIDISNLANGLYLIKFDNTDNITMMKFVKE